MKKREVAVAVEGKKNKRKKEEDKDNAETIFNHPDNIFTLG